MTDSTSLEKMVGKARPTYIAPGAYIVRTNLSLETVGRLVEGKHENPFELLGPHEVEVSGHRAMAVRAFLPDSTQAWVVHPAHDRKQPMRRIHPAGLFEAICPLPHEEDASHYLIRAAEEGGKKITM